MTFVRLPLVFRCPMLAAYFRRLAARRTAARVAALTLGTARLRAARGAAFLDAMNPAWAARVDAGRLELADGAACVLGQLHGDYRLGLGRSRVIDLSSAPIASLSPVDLGFQAHGGLGEAAEALDYALLTRAWREQVCDRQPAAPAVGAFLNEPRRRNVASPAQ